MISIAWLEKLKMDPKDIAEILEKDKQYADMIAPLAEAYMDQAPTLKPFTQSELVAAKEEALSFLEKTAQPAETEGERHMLHLLFWLHCIPYLEKVYAQLEIGNDVLVNSLMDLTYKVRECRKHYGYCGVVTPRFYQIFRCALFGLGRLQYATLVYEEGTYTSGGYALNSGDRVFACHIPSSGKLTPELCMESLDRAYQFFKNDLKDHILPVCCGSWLLYPPYTEKVFPEGSNTKAFSRMFDVISTNDWGENFAISQIVFGMPYGGDPEILPQNTSLQKNFVSYIRSGGSFGSGYGILLYDGIKKEIINRR